MKSEKTDLLGSLQTKIMDIIWKAKRPLKPAEVLKQLDGDYAYTTIMTILMRLTEKKLLKREFVGKVYYYSSLSNRKNFIKTNLKGIYGDLVSSYGNLAIAQFVDVIKDNKKDMELLKEYLVTHR